jgi:alcohol dehydrogenase (cytochrome c)
VAQSPAQLPHALGPGDPAWRGETVQIGQASPGAMTGGLDPAAIMKPLSDQWLSYSGDLSGKRYSLLKQVNTNTVKNLSLKWITSITTGCGPDGTGPAAGAAGGAAAGGGGRGGGGGGRGGGGGGGGYPIHVGGLGTGEANSCAQRAPGGGILFVDGVIYAGTPFNVYAIDARDGTILWHYYWKTRGGTALQTRGVGMWRNLVYFTMHDNWVVCLDAKTGREVWRHEIAPHAQQYFSSNAPMVVGDHVLVGTGNDLDAPAFLKSLNPRTGAVEWILYSTPQQPGDPGIETWASLDAARHGNGATWIPGSYDPETNLYIY